MYSPGFWENFPERVVFELSLGGEVKSCLEQGVCSWLGKHRKMLAHERRELGIRQEQQARRLEEIPDHAQESGLDFKGKRGQLIRCTLPGWDGR